MARAGVGINAREGEQDRAVVRTAGLAPVAREYMGESFGWFVAMKTGAA